MNYQYVCYETFQIGGPKEDFAIKNIGMFIHCEITIDYYVTKYVIIHGHDLTHHFTINHVIINLKDGFDIDLADISDQWTSKNGEIPDQHNLLGAKFSTFDKVT